MILEETIQKLVDMELHAMAAMMRERASSPRTDPLSTDQGLGMLIDREWTSRENKRLGRLLKEARVPQGACIENLACEAGRGVDKALARTFANCQWVRAKQNIIVVGATGAGKSFLGGALAQSGGLLRNSALRGSVRKKKAIHAEVHPTQP